MIAAGGEADLKAVRLIIKGNVQGVFFRQTAKDKAAELGIMGQARNEADGSVVIEAEGSAAALQEFIAWCRQGPPLAQVADVKIQPQAPQRPAAFSIQ